MNTTYTVSGMTCQHCVASVTEELMELPGVEKVEVDLASGSVQISSQQGAEPSREQVRAAVDEAGYELT